MRKYLALALAGVLAVVGVVAVAVADESVQTETAKIKPNKLPKKKYKNIKYVNTIETANAAGMDEPPDATRTVVDFPKQFKFNNKKFPTCKSGDPEGALGAATTAKDAEKACGKGSKVSDDKGSSAVVTVAGAVPGTSTEIPVDVIAFNGKKSKFYLWSKPQGLAAGLPASILVGKLKKSKSGKKFGKALDVTIPDLAAGAISFFEVTIPKSKYVQARCKPKKMTVRATTTFTGQPKSSDDYSFKCKPKKKKH